MRPLARVLLLCVVAGVVPCAAAADDGGPDAGLDGAVVGDGGAVDAEPDAAPDAEPEPRLPGLDPDTSPEDRRAVVADALAAMPEAADDTAPETGVRRSALESRLALLDELIAARRSVAEHAGRRADLAERQAAHEAEVTAFDALPPAQADPEVSAGSIEAGEGQAEALSQAVAVLEQERDTARARLSALPAELQDVRRRQQAAAALASTLETEARALPEGRSRDRITDRIDTARLEVESTTTRGQALEAELDALRASSTLLDRQIDLARRRQRRQERILELDRKAYEATLQAAEAERTIDLEAAREALETATTPAEQLRARARVMLAESSSQLAEATRLGVSLDRTLAQQGKILEAEQAEFDGLSNLVERDTSGRAAAKLKDVFQRLERRYDELSRVRTIEGLDALSGLRSRRLEVAGLLFELDDRWPLQIDALGETASRSEVRTLTDRLRGALRAEQDAITGTLASGESLLALLDNRERVLTELDGMVRSRIFWVQDQPPLGVGMIAGLREEFSRVTGFLAAAQTWRAEGRPGAWPFEALVAVGLVGAALLLGAWFDLRRVLALRWRERQLPDAEPSPPDDEDDEVSRVTLPLVVAVERPPDGPPPDPATPGADEAPDAAELETANADAAPPEDAAEEHGPPAPPVLLLAIVATLAWPFIMWGAARLVDLSALPPPVRPPLVAGLDTMAVVLLISGICALLFRPGGLAEIELGLPLDTTASLRSTTRTGLVLATVILPLGHAMEAAPLELVVAPRLDYSIFEVVVLVLVLRLLRPSSPVIRDLMGQAGLGGEDRPWMRLTGPAWLALAVFGIAVVGMDLAGYRYGAGWLAVNALESLGAFGLAFLAWPPLRDRLSPVLVGAVGGGDDDPDDPDGPRRARRLLGALLVIGAISSMVVIWDIDRRALGFLDAMTLYTMGSGEAAEAVTLADLVRVLLTAVITTLALKWLPRLSELTLFRYVDFDAGARYAIVTIARYAVFFIGVVVAIDALHLDVSRLGWLVAAVGVGLGFGLQEIVANFVSGLILLMERPIRIGDWVSIGAVQGTVQRINIRATTVMTLDRQEIIVPNKDFITKEVVNWTHGDRIVRLKVTVGVAYGTDIDQMRRILLDIAARHPAVLTHPPPAAILAGHGDSALDFELMVHHMDPARQMPLLGELNREINRRLTEAEIEIPFPQRDLNLRTGWPPAPADPATPSGDESS